MFWGAIYPDEALGSELTCNKGSCFESDEL